MTNSDYDKIIDALVAAAPPLTEEQRYKLSVLMYPEGIHLRKPDFAKIQSVLLLNEYKGLGGCQCEECVLTDDVKPAGLLHTGLSCTQTADAAQKRPGPRGAG